MKFLVTSRRTQVLETIFDAPTWQHVHEHMEMSQETLDFYDAHVTEEGTTIVVLDGDSREAHITLNADGDYV